jgi:hypothetical protein
LRRTGGTLAAGTRKSGEQDAPKKRRRSMRFAGVPFGVAVVLGTLGAAVISASATPAAMDAPADPSAAEIDSAAHGDSSASKGDLLPCTSANEPANYQVFSLGPSVATYKASSEQRVCEPYQEGDVLRANLVSYIYGSCEPSAEEERCEPPLEIQTWPACERNLATYELEPGTPYPHQYLGEVRGAPAYSFDGGTRVEIYSADATIVIFSTSSELAKTAMLQVQPESPSAPPPTSPSLSPDGAAAPLPPPDDGSLDGTLTCA